MSHADSRLSNSLEENPSIESTSASCGKYKY
jgi:hypothetical protein